MGRLYLLLSASAIALLLGCSLFASSSRSPVALSQKQEGTPWVLGNSEASILKQLTYHPHAEKKDAGNPVEDL
eukprot:750287-Hanusia_phi.AAC.2